MTKPITFVVHRFTVGDVDDPMVYAALPMYEWQQSEAGKWMMKHSNPTPSWHQQIDWAAYGTRFEVRGYLTPELYTYWKLKYD